jgi:hypothetical protein
MAVHWRYEARGHYRSWSLRQIDSRGALGRDHRAAGSGAGQGLLAARSCGNTSRSLDSDLGLYDVVEIRLRSADTILFLDFSLLRCVWRAIQRSRERLDFWRWLLAYRWQGRPVLMEAIAKHAVHADLHVFRNPAALRRFVAEIARESRPE